MSYVILRNETHLDGQRFIGLQITDELGLYNFARWLTSEQKTQYETNPQSVIDDLVISAHAWKLSQIPEVDPNIFTKLQIRRAMRSLGIEFKLDSLLESNEIFKKDWTDAVEISLNDELVQQALQLIDVDIEVVKSAII